MNNCLGCLLYDHLLQTREDKIKDRLRNISDMEHRYDDLQTEKRLLESSLTKIPIHGRVDRNNRRQKVSLHFLPAIWEMQM